MSCPKLKFNKIVIFIIIIIIWGGGRGVGGWGGGGWGWKAFDLVYREILVKNKTKQKLSKYNLNIAIVNFL